MYCSGAFFFRMFVTVMLPMNLWRSAWLALLATSCGCGPPAERHTIMDEDATITILGANVGEGEFSDRQLGPMRIVSWGKIQLSKSGTHLFVNGKNFSPVLAGDHVVIDVDRVEVNGEKRDFLPREFSDD